MTDYQAILKRYWGYDSFRSIQRDIIESIGSGHDTLGLMPTGGGKSLCFQVPAMAKEGTCIVITPLIALMKDQVQHLRQRGIKAAAIYTGMSHEAILTTLENAVFGAVKLLYVSPERLSSDLFIRKLQHMKVCFICVDEAHCISQWGYDFRPSYLTIVDIRRLLPDTPVLALTATATPKVVDDITSKLCMPAANRSSSTRNEEGHQHEDSSSGTPGQTAGYTVHNSFRVFTMSFERKNLAYVVRQALDKRDQLIHILNNVEGSAIVYARSRRRTKEFAELLSAAGISATFFHAGLDNAEKDRRQQQWQHDEVRVMVATNAFGMGIDKPDVRLVIHIDCPSSPEAYFQEAGRAGRDGKKAYAVLLYNNSDRHKLEKRIKDTFPDKDYIRQVYEHLSYFYQVAVGSGYHATFELPIDKFCKTFYHHPIRLISALHILDRAGYMQYIEEQDCQARVRFILERDELYLLQHQSPLEERVIESLLRTYSGLFNDFMFIDESYIAQLTGLRLPQVYLTLKSLASRHIIEFIPQKRTPYVRYLQRREDAEHLIFPPAIYEDLKQRFTERIEAMISYATNDSVCRSRQLLHYFGETRSTDCGQCDVCLDHSGAGRDSKTEHHAQGLITALLADGQPHFIAQLHSLPLPYTQIEAALDYLLQEEQVYLDNGMLRKA